LEWVLRVCQVSARRSATEMYIGRAIDYMRPRFSAIFASSLPVPDM